MLRKTKYKTQHFFYMYCCFFFVFCICHCHLFNCNLLQDATKQKGNRKYEEKKNTFTDTNCIMYQFLITAQSKQFILDFWREKEKSVLQRRYRWRRDDVDVR